MKLGVRINGLEKKKISKTVCFIGFIAVIIISLCGGSTVCLAWSAGGLKSTIASIIISMLMSSGAGVTNMDWLNQLNNAYGVESTIGTLENAISQGLLTESGGVLIDTGLSDAIMANPAYTDLGLDDLFTTTAADAVIESGTIAASGGANIAAESIGAVSMGTVGQAFVAVGAGIGLGVLAHHFMNKFGKPMTNAAPININETTLNRLIAGGSYGETKGIISGHNLSDQVMCPAGVYIVRYTDNYGSSMNLAAVNTTDEAKSFTRYSVVYDGSNTVNNFNVNANSFANRASNISTSYVTDIFPEFPIYTYNQLSEIANGNIQINKYSPDVVGEEGNQTGTYNDETGYNFPYIKPYYNPQQKGLTPIDMDDYLDFARSANDLTDQGRVGTDQADHFQDFINPYLSDQEPVIPEQDPDYTDPDTIPEQPDFTDKNPVTPEDISDSDAYTTPDLMDRFPFCIPNDILAIFRKFKMGREAPVIDWNFKYDAIGLDEHIVIDLSEFDSVASILRTLELIAFIVGLGFATRYLIGG